MSNFEQELVELAVKYGVISEYAARNWKIYQRYKILHYENKMKSHEAFEVIASEFPPITTEGIIKIVYREKKRDEAFRASKIINDDHF